MCCSGSCWLQTAAVWVYFSEGWNFHPQKYRLSQRGGSYVGLKQSVNLKSCGYSEILAWVDVLTLD